MSQRITIKDLTAYCDLINKHTGAAPRSEGYVEIGSAYGGYRVETEGGSRDLSARGTARECYQWLDGYYQAVVHAQQGDWAVGRRPGLSKL